MDQAPPTISASGGGDFLTIADMGKNQHGSRFKHGHAKTPKHPASLTYHIWANIVQRCTNPKSSRFSRYGGIGRGICPEWLEFARFLEDMGEKPEGLTLDRIKNDLGYSKENCRWADYKTQNRNRRDNVLLVHNGTTLCLAAWAERIGIKTSTLHARLRYRGWPLEKALGEPVRKWPARKGVA